MTRRIGMAALLAARELGMAALAMPSPTLAMQILDAADHAELAAEIIATHVNRIALHGGRIARLVRAPDSFAVEHDAASGDLYLRPAGGASPSGRFRRLWELARRPSRVDSSKSPSSHAGLVVPVPRGRYCCMPNRSCPYSARDGANREPRVSSSASTMPRALSKALTCAIAMRTGMRHDTDFDRLAA